MTTIACDGKTVAGDGMVSGDGICHDTKFCKVYRLRSGAVVGWTGTPYQRDDLLEYMEGGAEKLNFGDKFEAIILHPDGACEFMDGFGNRFRVSTPCAAGTGTVAAMGAMLAGASSYDAVRIACLLDLESGGEITEVSPVAE